MSAEWRIIFIIKNGLKMINARNKKFINRMTFSLSLLSLIVSCNLLPTGPELTTKYLIFTFIVESDSCQYSSAFEKGNGLIKAYESPFVLKLESTSDDLGDLVAINFSDTSNVYVNFQKTMGEREIEKDYVISPNQSVLINMNQ